MAALARGDLLIAADVVITLPTVRCAVLPQASRNTPGYIRVARVVDEPRCRPQPRGNFLERTRSACGRRDDGWSTRAADATHMCGRDADSAKFRLVPAGRFQDETTATWRPMPPDIVTDVQFAAVDHA